MICELLGWDWRAGWLGILVDGPGSLTCQLSNSLFVWDGLPIHGYSNAAWAATAAQLGPAARFLTKSVLAAPLDLALILLLGGLEGMLHPSDVLLRRQGLLATAQHERG